MNRDLTVNLKIVTAGGENSRAASEAIDSVTASAKAAMAATGALAQAHQTAAGAANTIASASRSVGEAVTSSARSMRTATDGVREYATATERLDAKFADLEKGLQEVNSYFNDLDESKKRLAQADQKYLSGVKETIGGVTSLARSVVLLVAANEEQSSSMLKIIARFESAAQAIKGVISIISGATRAWTAYTAAASAAAVASRFSFGGSAGQLAAVGGVAAAGGAAGASMAAPAAAAGAAAASSVFGTYALSAAGLTTAVLDTGLITLAAPFLAGAMGGFGAFQGASQLFGIGRGGGFVNQGFSSEQQFESLPNLIVSTWNARNSERASAAGVARMQQQLAEREEMNNRTSNRRVRDQRISRAQWDIDTEQTMFIASLQDPARNPNWRDQYQSQFRVNSAEATAIQRRLLSADLMVTNRDNAEAAEKKQEERNQLNERLNDLTRQRLSLMQQEAETANRIVASQRQSLAQMGSGDTRRLADAIRTAESGGDLTARQIALLRQNNIVGYEDQIRSNEERLISRDPNARYIYENQREKTQVDELNKNYNIAVNSEMVLKVQAEIDKTAPQWMSEAMKFLTQQVERIKQETATLINQQFDNEARRGEQNGKAQGGNGTPPSPTGGWGSGP